MFSFREEKVKRCSIAAVTYFKSFFKEQGFELPYVAQSVE